MSEHTPGPWSASMDALGCKQITADNGGEVAYTPGLANEEEDLANAHLIAAAPDLQKALLRLAMYCSGRLPTKEDLDGAEMKGAAAALAKARGEPAQ